MVIKQVPHTHWLSTGHPKPTLSYYGNWGDRRGLFQTPGTAHAKQRSVLVKNWMTQKNPVWSIQE